MLKGEDALRIVVGLALMLVVKLLLVLIVIAKLAPILQ